MRAIKSAAYHARANFILHCILCILDALWRNLSIHGGPIGLVDLEEHREDFYCGRA